MAMDNGAESNFFWVVLFEDRSYFIIPDIWMWPENQLCLLPNAEQQEAIGTAAQTRTPPGGNWISHNIKKTYGPYGTYDQAMGECEHLGENSDSDTEDERNSVLRSTSHEPNVAVENPERVRSPIPASTSPITSINESDDSIRSTPRTQDPVASESNERDIGGIATGLQQLELLPQIAQSNNQSVGIFESTRFDGSFKLRTVEDVMALENLMRIRRKAEELGRYFTTVYEKYLLEEYRLGSRPTFIDSVQRPVVRIFEDNGTTFYSWANRGARQKIRDMRIFDVLYNAYSEKWTNSVQENFVITLVDLFRKIEKRLAGSASRNTVAEN